MRSGRVVEDEAPAVNELGKGDDGVETPGVESDSAVTLLG